ncbi:MAG: sps1B [Myxococcales bacterium]|nr:sps1B [Myxococcales bacterium]
MDALDDQDTEADARIGALVDGRYKILEAMASGSMGAVYKGERVPVGKLVAIKFLHASFAKDSEFLSRFERETRVMSKLSHPNCVSVVDFGVWDGAPYLVMEYVGGTTLRALIDIDAIPPQRALLLTRQIVSGLAHAHAQGVVHRDIKPANIMISDEVGTGDHVRILDFGLARLRGNVGRDATQTNVVVGTPNYMAPEQTIGGGTVDARTDVYAVGIVLFEMICGERPFNSDDTLALLGMHRAAPIPRLADRIDHTVALPLGVQAIIDKAMAKSPDDRFQTAIEFANAIDAIIGPRVSGEHEVVSPRGIKGRTEPALAVAPTMVDLDSGNHSGKVATTIKERTEPVRVTPKGSSGPGLILVLLLLVGAAGAAVWYTKLRPRANGQGSAVGSVSGSDSAGALPPNVTVGTGSGEGALPGSNAAGSDGSAVSAVAAGSGSAGSADVAGLGSGEGSGSAGSGSAMTVAAGSGTEAASGSAAGSGSAIDVGSTGDLGSGAGSADVGTAGDEIEMDPVAATNPDPSADKTTAEDEAPDAPTTVEDVEKKLPVTPVRAKSVAEAVQMIKDGKRDLALSSLLSLQKKSPKSAYISFLLGNLYYDKLWWGVALDNYKAAIARNAGYKRNDVLTKNVIRMLASDKTRRNASTFLRWTLARNAVSQLRTAAKNDPNGNVRKHAAALAKAIR